MLGETLSIRGLLACVCILTFHDKTTANGQHTLKYTTMDPEETASVNGRQYLHIQKIYDIRKLVYLKIYDPTSACL